MCVPNKHYSANICGPLILHQNYSVRFCFITAQVSPIQTLWQFENINRWSTVMSSFRCKWNKMMREHVVEHICQKSDDYVPQKDLKMCTVKIILGFQIWERKAKALNYFFYYCLFVEFSSSSFVISLMDFSFAPSVDGLVVTGWVCDWLRDLNMRKLSLS